MKQQNWIPWLYLVLGLTQAAHSVEEVLTGLWKNLPIVTALIHDRVQSVPVMQWSMEGFAAANLVIVALMLGFSPFVFQKHAWAVKIVRVVAVIEVLNGLLHLIPAIITGGYWPGSVSAVFLLGIGLIILLTKESTHEFKRA
jgi:hypothetical protein